MSQLPRGDWYFYEALKKLEQAKKLKGNGRRRKTLNAIKLLIWYICKRKNPECNAIAQEDDPRCDRCFRKTQYIDGGMKELCSKCEELVKQQQTKVNSLPDNLFLKVSNRRIKNNTPAADDYRVSTKEHKEKIKKHQKRVEKDMKRLRFGRNGYAIMDDYNETK